MDFLKTLRLSRPKVKKICGIEIKKAPVGRYLDIIATMSGTVMELMDAAFPGQTPSEIIILLQHINQSELRDILRRVLAVVPAKALEILGAVLDVSPDRLRDELTPAELTLVCKAFWELNDYSDFFANVRELLPTARKAANGGSSSSSPKA